MIKVMQICARVCSFISLEASLRTDQKRHQGGRESDSKALGAICSALYSSHECHTTIYWHGANNQNLDILGSIEILARTRPVQMARMVTLVQHKKANHSGPE